MKYNIYFIAFLLLFLSWNNLFGQNEVNPNQLKSKLIFKFGENIMWPQEQAIDTFIIGVIDINNPVLPYLLRLAKYKQIKNKPVVVRSYKNILFNSVPHLIILDSKFNSSIKRLRKFSFAFPILVVSSGLTNEEDIMINFVEQNDRLTFQINSENLIKQELTASSSLLLLGASVGDILNTYKLIDNKLLKAQKALITQQTDINSQYHKIDSINVVIGLQNKQFLNLEKLIKSKEDSLYLKELELSNQNSTLNLFADSINELRKMLAWKNLAFLKQEIDLLDKQRAIEAYNHILNRQKKEILSQTNELIVQKRFVENQNLKVQNQKRKDYYYIFVSLAFIVAFILIFIYVIRKNKYSKKIEIANAKVEHLERKLINSDYEVNSLKLNIDTIKVKNEEYFELAQITSLYVKKTQQALLSFFGELEFYFEAFNVLMAKDGNSSDFIFFHRQEASDLFSEKYILGIGDCVQDSIAGSFISLVASQILKESVILNPNAKLEALVDYMSFSYTKIMQRTFLKDNPFLNLSLLSLERQIGNKIHVKYVGAGQDLFCFRKKDMDILVIVADKNPIGQHSEKAAYNFKQTELVLEKGDMLYLCSNGMLNQKSPNGNKFGKDKLKELIINVGVLPLFRQREIIKSSFNSFIQNKELDADITLIGLRL